MKKGPGAGLKTKIDELSKQVQEMRLNLDRNLEDVRVLKASEKERQKIGKTHDLKIKLNFTLI